MHQPSPSAGQVPPEPVRPGQPRSVVMAVRLMYAGAVVSALTLILGLLAIGSIRTSLHKASPTLTQAQLHTLTIAFVVGTVIYEVIVTGLWLLMAFMNGAGRAWARIVASILFGLNTLLTILTLAGSGVAVSGLAGLITWLIGLAAIIFLWRKDSGEYFAPQGQQAG